MPDDKLEEQLKICKKSLNKLVKVMEVVEPILFDLKDGTLKRVSKSRYRPTPVDAITEIDSDDTDEPNPSELSSQNFSGDEDEEEDPD